MCGVFEYFCGVYDSVPPKILDFLAILILDWHFIIEISLPHIRLFNIIRAFHFSVFASTQESHVGKAIIYRLVLHSI